MTYLVNFCRNSEKINMGVVVLNLKTEYGQANTFLVIFFSTLVFDKISPQVFKSECKYI